MLKRAFRKIAPGFAINLYHYLMALLAAARYRWPSKRMIVIGVTGTSGKSTTCFFLSRLLEASGAKVGMASTIYFKIGEKEWLNDKKMTMVGRFQLQKLLADMRDAGCRYAIVETTSEGVKQSRHRGIMYDVVVFTNLYPEHIESHGSFEKYQQAKGRLFQHLTHWSPKVLDGEIVPRVKVVNIDDEYAEYFLSFASDHTYGYGLYGDGFDFLDGVTEPVIPVMSRDLQFHKKVAMFTVNGVEFKLKVLGGFNVYNALAAISVGYSQNIPLPVLAKALERIRHIPGRIERIEEGQPYTVIVDYAFEPRALEKLYEAVESSIPHKRIIHVMGATGGGRDVHKRPTTGALVSERADVVIVTNEDPYDDDPVQIIEDVALGAESVDAGRRAEVHRILDRREAIRFAIDTAEDGDLVLITGKGSEQAMVVSGQLVPWDDRKEARQAISARRRATMEVPYFKQEKA